MPVDSLVRPETDTAEVAAPNTTAAVPDAANDAAEVDTTNAPTNTNTAASATGETTQPKRGKAKTSTAKKTRTVELTLTVTGTADGEWQAELKHGSKWVTRGLEIPAAAVSRAAKELHAELSTPIDEVINAARAQQQAKVAQLEAELEQAKLTLAELNS